MTYVEHIRLVARGSLGAAGAAREHWSCGLNFIPEGGIPTVSWPELLETYANDAFDDWAGFITDTGSRVYNAVSLDEVRGYRIHTDGKAHDDVGISTRTPVRSVLSPTKAHPYQVSLCVTLDAGRPKAGRFGRIYLPPMAYDIDANEGTVATSDFNAIWTATQSLLTNLSNIPGVDASWQLAVAGQTGGGTLRPVTSIRLGHVPDTVRRRRRQLVEGYASVDFDA